MMTPERLREIQIAALHLADLIRRCEHEWNYEDRYPEVECVKCGAYLKMREALVKIRDTAKDNLIAAIADDAIEPKELVFSDALKSEGE